MLFRSITAHTVASRNYGYVFNNCTIDGASLCDNNYRLGRNWGAEARAIYLNTTMNLIPASDGWSQMNNDNQPAWFGEYKSVDKSGNPVDCSNRKKTFCSSSVSYNTVLTDAQAAEFTIENVIGGDDDWEPNVYTEQLLAPFIQIENNVISWTENKYALCWGIFRNGKIVEFVTENSYAVPVGNEGAVYTVRAANEYGGLSETSNKVTAVETVVDAEIDSAVNNTVNEKTEIGRAHV